MNLHQSRWQKWALQTEVVVSVLWHQALNIKSDSQNTAHHRLICINETKKVAAVIFYASAQFD